MARLNFAQILPHLCEPIDDLAERAPGNKYSETEAQLRCKLAAVYRLVDLFGWTNSIYSHITARTPDGNILINPFGMLYYEVTASSLIKINLQGDIIDPGSTNFGINNRAYTLHSAIHGARHDILCVLHLHTPEAMAFTALKGNNFPQLFQESQIFDRVAFLEEYGGSLTDLGERKLIVDALGTSKVLLLRNHGFVCCGKTVEETIYLCHNLVTSMAATVKLAGLPGVLVPSRETLEITVQDGYKGEPTPGKMWPIGELEWEAHMRVLDKMGLKTGHQYKLNI